jgi:hypothetical protein
MQILAFSGGLLFSIASSLAIESTWVRAMENFVAYLHKPIVPAREELRNPAARVWCDVRLGR